MFSTEGRAALINVAIKKEVHEAFMIMDFFLKTYIWHLTGDDVWRLVKGAFHNGSFDPQLKPLDLKLIMISDQELCAQSW
jgi:hypothetical protein